MNKDIIFEVLNNFRKTAESNIFLIDLCEKLIKENVENKQNKKTRYDEYHHELINQIKENLEKCGSEYKQKIFSEYKLKKIEEISDDYLDEFVKKVWKFRENQMKKNGEFTKYSTWMP